jgi:hypothetical protein
MPMPMSSCPCTCPLHMHACVGTSVRAHPSMHPLSTCMHPHAHTSISARACAHACMCIHTPTRTSIHASSPTHACMRHAYAQAHIPPCACMHVSCVHACECTCMRGSTHPSMRMHACVLRSSVHPLSTHVCMHACACILPRCTHPCIQSAAYMHRMCHAVPLDKYECMCACLCARAWCMHPLATHA